MKHFTKTLLSAMLSVCLLFASNAWSQDRELTGEITLNTTECNLAQTVDLEFGLDAYSPDYEWVDHIIITFPDGVTPIAAADITASYNTLDFTGIDGQEVEWGTGGYLSTSNLPTTFVVTCEVGLVSGVQEIDYWVSGDIYGAEPHEFSGTLDLTVNANDEATFYMDPTEYTFPCVGLLGGTVYEAVPNAEFTITNTGVGSLTISDLDFFGFQGDEFAIPASFMGQLPVTLNELESFTFEVEFNPTSAGDKFTNLVVTDDLDRLTRTFDIYACAYEKPAGDVLENAIALGDITDSDHNQTIDFGHYYMDYDLEATDADVVFTFSVGIESFFSAGGADHVAIFQDGITIADGNEFAEGTDLDMIEMSTGSYVAVFSGAGSNDIYLHAEGADPIYAITPDGALDLGDVPIGGWYCPREFNVWNAGGQYFTIYDFGLSDVEGVFELRSSINEDQLPYDVYTGDVLTFNIDINTNDAGVYNGSFLLEDDVTTRVYPITANVYEAPNGDIMENPYVVTWDINNEYHDESDLGMMYNNYDCNLAATTADVVYRFEYALDMIVDIQLSGLGAGFEPYMALIDGNDVGVIDPMDIVPVAEGTTDILDQQLAPGAYYLIVSGEVADPAYILDIAVENLPAPGEFCLTAPADGAVDVALQPTLSWEAAENAVEYDLYYGTSYPPSNVVTLTETEYTFDSDLYYANVYFWYVVAKNTNGTMNSCTTEASPVIWGFTTEIPGPNSVTAVLSDYNDVHVSWYSPFEDKFVVDEDFEAEIFPPAGWDMTTNSVAATGGWTRNDNNSSQYFSIPPHTFYASTNDDAANDDGSVDYLWMPAADFSAFEEASLTFESFLPGDYGTTGHILITTDDGATFETVLDVELSSAWTEVEIDLTDYCTPEYADAKIVFHSNDNNIYADGWAIDDVYLELMSSLGGGGAILGYNVYQNGVLINDDYVQDLYYDVMDLPAGTYEFCVSAVFPEGESDAICAAPPVEVLGLSNIYGAVTGPDGQVIEGAVIELIGDFPFSFGPTTATTDVNGEYDFGWVPVLADGYTVTCEFPGFMSASIDDVEPTEGAPEEVNFQLMDVPVPAFDVWAEINDADTEATITWGEPVLQSEFVLELMTDNWPGETTWNLKNSYGDVVASGGPYSSPMTLNTETAQVSPGYYTFTIFDSYGDGICCAEGNGYYNLIVDGETIHSGGEFGSEEIVEFTAYGAVMSITNVSYAVDHGYAKGETIMDIADIPVESTTQTFELPANGSREIQNYKVQRLMVGQEDDDPSTWPVVNASTTELTALDTEWVDLDQGEYRYAVITVYTLNESAPAFSNIVGKDMTFDAIIEVTLNTGETPEGVSVTLTNVDSEYFETQVTPASGLAHFYDFYKGNVTLLVTKDGFVPYYEEIYVYDDDYLIREVELQEALCPVVDLAATVDCKDVTLTWTEPEDCTVIPGATYEFTVQVYTDDYAYETSWELEDEAGTIIGEEGPYSDDFTMHEATFTLESGVYSWTIYDNANDGICCGYGDGYYNLLLDGEIIATGGEFGSSETITFDTEDAVMSIVQGAYAVDAGIVKGEILENASEIPVDYTTIYEVENTRELQGYKIFREDVEIGETTELTFLDENVGGGLHRYAIVAIYLTGNSPAAELQLEVEYITPVSDLAYEVESIDNVILTWAPPGELSQYTLTWDNGENYTSIGSNSGDLDFDVAHRYTPAELSTYDGYVLREISMYAGDDAAEISLRVFVGEDATMIVDQPVDVVAGEWNTFMLDTPVAVDASEDLWIGYRCNSPIGVFAAGCDAGPAVSGKGNMIYTADDGWVQLTDLAASLDYNWNIQGVVYGEGEAMALAPIQDENRISGSTVIETSGIINDNPSTNNADREFLHYYVTREGDVSQDEVVVAENLTNNFFIDFDVKQYYPDGAFTYCVYAVYSEGCEAVACITADDWVDVNNLDATGMNVYPNPANEYFFVEVPAGVETVKVINTLGQVVYQETVTDSKVYISEDFTAGTYMIQAVKSTGEMINKRLVITK